MFKYWMVHNTAGSPPNKRHGTKQSAIDEATRLAKQHPQATFAVLEAVETYSVTMPEPKRALLEVAPEAKEATHD